jgi:hypothetical protein
VLSFWARGIVSVGEFFGLQVRTEWVRSRRRATKVGWWGWLWFCLHRRWWWPLGFFKASPSSPSRKERRTLLKAYSGNMREFSFS